MTNNEIFLDTISRFQLSEERVCQLAVITRSTLSHYLSPVDSARYRPIPDSRLELFLIKLLNEINETEKNEAIPNVLINKG